MSYQPIGDYGIIGNMRTTALVGLNGSIDWFCHPRHDSPSIFGAILDSQKGGHFKIESLIKGDNHRQFYYPETNILITRFLCDCGVGEVVDFMPLGNSVIRNWIIRQVRTVRNEIKFRAECYPAFDYGRATHKTTRTGIGARFSCVEDPYGNTRPNNSVDDGAKAQYRNFELVTEVPLEVNERGAFSEFTLKEGETATFLFRPAQSVTEEAPLSEKSHKSDKSDSRSFVRSSDKQYTDALSALSRANTTTKKQQVSPTAPLSEHQLSHLDQTAESFFSETVTYWRKWLSQCVYTGRWRGRVKRSALALKLMTYEPTGAIIAAPTTSLPEKIGGERNWDYRYTWIRDAAFTVYALIRIGFTEEAKEFMQWLEARCQELGKGGSLQVMYRIDGQLDLQEEHLDHWEGYKGSQPVRIGNGAFEQLQLDICGELMDSAYLYNKHGSFISHDFWTHLRYLTNWVCDNWQRQDQGVWESRGGKKNHVYSRLMCWVAIDRALRIATTRSFPAERSRWESVRDEIYEEILEKGWDEDRQAFVQAYGSPELDAGCLIMPLVFFMAPSDPKMLKTIETVKKSPQAGGLSANSLVYRYNPLDSQGESTDGLEGAEGTFNLCTFWLVEALTRAGRVQADALTEARRIFEEMLTYANHLGLYSEELGISGEALGNFPQAFTHIALISAAWNLDEALDKY
ncbi:MAG: glycosyl hydrolase [Phormidesmis priestleyi Ana]|uniref:Glycosyl hydrolase n=1 Tax=Phormidesmis priestleyi Ana TaxID=1666911 RepID=A0A0P7YXC7_9CYAN|nr:MAG: glycosyl hydrolase [Phormidesmis priestleyi Ana]